MVVEKKIVLVTGGTGTIGRKVVEKLLARKYSVYVLSRKQGQNSGKVNYLWGDINDKINLKKCDYIIHLAANLSHGDKEGCEAVNVNGTKNILATAEKLKIKKMVHVSTIMVYKDNQGEVMTEKSNRYKRSEDPYVDTKTRAEELVRQEKIPAVVVYPTVVVDLKNRGEPAGSKIARMLWKMSGSFNGCLNGLIGSNQRMINYVLVDDVAEGIVLALEKGKIGDSYILGGENITIGEYLKKMAGYYKTHTLPIRLPGFLGKTKEMNFSSEKAKEELGYKPKTI
jgi:nucleoside-diphosphate-sugar epimerase